MNQQKGFANIVLIVLVVALAGIVGYFALVKKSPEVVQQTSTQTPKNDQSNNQTPAPISTPTSTSFTQSDLNRIFELNNKQAGTKIYYSDKLGIGFTYLPFDFSPIVGVSESANKITVGGPDGQSVEVFVKNPNITLEKAIEQRFLQGYSSADCFVRVYDYTESFQSSEQNLVDYVKASIGFPPASDPDEPWWKNAEKCPSGYTTTGGVAYFLYNKRVPGKYAFVSVGQYSAASDGTPLGTNPNFNWDRSIRILK